MYTNLFNAYWMVHSGFSQKHNIGKIAIIVNFVFPYICSFHHCLHHMMSINMELEVGDCKWIINFIGIVNF